MWAWGVRFRVYGQRLRGFRIDARKMIFPMIGFCDLVS